MRRIVLLSIFIALIPALLFAASGERIWVYTDEGKNITSFDLSRTLYMPKLSTAYKSGKDYGNPSDGTYSPVNIIGNFGCINCGCKIKFTISTTGRFVSQSDPSKYCDFQLGIMPRITDQGGDKTYLWDESVDPHTRIDSSLRVPHFEINSSGAEQQLEIWAPGFTGSNYIDGDVLGDKSSKVSRWWGDLVMVLNELTAEDYRHMSENNDYIARVNISWCCENDHDEHSGSFTLVLRGYFGVAEGGKAAKVIVTQDPQATNLNILDVLRTAGNEQHIAQILVLSNTSTVNWANRIYVFLSSSPDWQSAGGSFAFKQVGTNPAKTIPYSVLVKYPNDAPIEYTGNDTYETVKANRSYLNLHVKPGTLNRDGKLAYIVDYTADVFIKIPNNSNQDISELTSGESTTVAEYAGIYTSNIYYHVIYDDSK